MNQLPRPAWSTHPDLGSFLGHIFARTLLAPALTDVVREHSRVVAQYLYPGLDHFEDEVFGAAKSFGKLPDQAIAPGKTAWPARMEMGNVFLEQIL